MKRFTTLLLSSLLLTITVFANPIDPDKAYEIASGVWKNSIKKNSDGALELIPRNKMSNGATASAPRSRHRGSIYSLR